MIDSLVAAAGTASVLAGVAWIAATVALLIMFAGIEVFGPINDALSVFQFLLLIPAALAIHRLLSPHGPPLSLAATIAGIAAMLVFAGLQARLVFRAVRFEQTLNAVLALAAAVGAWWLSTSILSLAQGTLPAGLAWVGVVAGVSNLLTAAAYWTVGQEHPLTAAGFSLNAVAVPVWCFWLGMVLRTS